MVEQLQQPEALPFISFDQSQDKFLINEQAAQIISQIEGPIGICSVAGMYRTGKSYLLNRMLLDRSDGFGVGPTINPCTKGLWIWSEPIKGITPDGKTIQVLVIDTEGLGAFDETQNHDVRIFTLAILLSSFFIYNSMGSIDETSLNQLSLVVNLTKNIQLREQKVGGTDELDPEEFQKIFPSFMWVVRDFSLQLVDENGNTISSKEYLEGALKEQKGFSAAVEQKNCIRRLLKAFFKERDCCTIVRPLSDESQLQNLSRKALTDLRKEFQEQVQNLRRKVLGKIKPKTLQGKELSGSIVITLAQQYVNSINSGAVPNIQSAWTYICQNECQKATAQSLIIFTDLISRIKLPCNQETLQQNIKESTSKAIKYFKDKVIGDQIKESKINLVQSIQQIAAQTLQTNHQLSQQAMIEFLRLNFQQIEVSIHSGQFKTIAQYRYCIEEFLLYVEQNSPQGCITAKAQVLKDFIAQSVITTSQYFCDQLEHENRMQQAIQDQHIKMQDMKLIEVKSELKRDLEQAQKMLRTAEQEKAELQGNDLHLRENLHLIKKLREEDDQKYRAEIELLKQQSQLEITSRDLQLQMKIDQAAESQKLMIQAQSELSKQSALYEQKITFLNMSASDREKSIKQLQLEVENLERQSQEILKQTTAGLTKELNMLKQELEESEERVNEAQHLLVQSQERWQSELNQMRFANTESENQLQVATQQIKLLVLKLQNVGDDDAEKIESLKKKLAQEIQAKEDIELQFKTQLSEFTEISQTRIKELEKELAISDQKQDFQKCQITQLQQQLQDRSHAHETILKALEEKANESQTIKEQTLEKIQQLQLQHDQTLQQQLQLLESTKQNFNEQLAQKQSQIADLETKCRFGSSEYQKSLQNLQETLDITEKERNHLENLLKQSDKTSNNTIEHNKQFYQKQIAALESEIEQITFQSEAATLQVQQNAEKSLANLKQIYEDERQRQEYRFQEDQKQSRIKLQKLVDEYEARIRDEQLQREDEVFLLQSNLHEYEKRLSQQINQLEYDNQLLQQKNQSNEERAQEIEQRHEREQRITAQQQQANIERDRQERSELQNKISELQRTLTLKEQESDVLKDKIENLHQQMEKMQNLMVQNQNKAASDNEKNAQKLEDLKVKCQQVSDEALRQKLDDLQAIALFKQRAEFQERKIEELIKQFEESNQKYEIRIKDQKSEKDIEIQELIKNYSIKIEHSETKYDQKRRKFKEDEQKFQRQLNELIKEKTSLEQQLINNQNMSNQIMLQHQQETNSLHEQIAQIQQQLQAERELLQTELDRVKQLLNNLEREHCDLQNTSERDRALLEGKCQFLEQQRDQAKADYTEASRKFEQAIEQIQKRGFIDKDRQESAQSVILNQIEQKLRKQIQDQNEEKQRLLQDYEEKIQSTKQSLRETKLELQLCEKDKQTLKKQLEKAIEEAQNRESELRQLLQSSQSERDSKTSSYVKSIEQQKEIQKQKMNELETRLKETETRRGHLIFELEKERAKWAIEREQLQNRVIEQQENIQNLERQKDSLIKDCEKLKTKKNSFVLNTTSNMGPIKSPGRYAPQSTVAPQTMETIAKSVFVGGMSKALLQAKETSDTSSQPEDLSNASNLLIPAQKSLENSFISRASSTNNGISSGLSKPQSSARVNVINFNLNRTKNILGNITNQGSSVRQTKDSSQQDALHPRE